MDDNTQNELNDMPLYVRGHDSAPLRRLAPKMKRNDICNLENKKFKKCCGLDGSNFCKKMLNDYLTELQKKYT